MPTIPLEKLFPDVHETGDVGVVTVDSSRPGVDPWRVDMMMFCGSSKCDCPDFLTNKKGKHRQLKNGAMPNKALECRHIERAHRYFYFKKMNELIEEWETYADENKEKAKARRMDDGVQRPARETHEASERPPGGPVATKYDQPSADWEDPTVPF